MISKSDIKMMTVDDELSNNLIDRVFDSDNQQTEVCKTKKLFTVPSVGFEGEWRLGETIELEVDTQ